MWSCEGFCFRFVVCGLGVCLVVLGGCQKPLELRLPDPERLHYVVEGYIEPGVPPVVVLMRSMGFRDTLSMQTYYELFVHGAVVRVSDGSQTVTLREIRTDTLPGWLLSGLQQFVTLPLDSVPPLYFYTTVDMVGVPGRTYSLEVVIPGDTVVLRSWTRIPGAPRPLDSLWVVPVNDSMVELWARFADPPETPQYYRYMVKRNWEPFCDPLGNVIEDRYFNGRTITFDINPGICNIYGYDFEEELPPTKFFRGDTVVIRWCRIDGAQYRFWLTLGFAISSLSNPFAGPVRVESNIEGGLGIWGSTHCVVQGIRIPE